MPESGQQTVPGMADNADDEVTLNDHLLQMQETASWTV